VCILHSEGIEDSSPNLYLQNASKCILYSGNMITKTAAIVEVWTGSRWLRIGTDGGHL